MAKVTEQASRHDNLECKTTLDLLKGINSEDRLVPDAVNKAIPQILSFVDEAYLKLVDGGRLFYIGAGTSGRLGIVDASECPPTFGVPSTLVTGIIAGGDTAIRTAVEFAEDDKEQAWKDLEKENFTKKDVLVGLSASGTTPYVIGALKKATALDITTACITCNLDSPMASVSRFPIEIIVGPEYVTGSTRMKAGTAQKLVLNMISTSLMIKLGKVEGNKMVNMALSNDKLWERGTKMLQEKLNISSTQALDLLKKHGSVKKAFDAYFE